MRALLLLFLVSACGPSKDVEAAKKTALQFSDEITQVQTERDALKQQLDHCEAILRTFRAGPDPAGRHESSHPRPSSP